MSRERAERGETLPFLAEDAEPIEYSPEFERIPLVLKADYAFDGRVSSTQTVILADGVDATATRVGALALVVHLRDRLTSTANFDVRCNNICLSPEQPELSFVDTSRTVGISTVISGSVPTAGLRFVEVIPLVQPVGPQLRVSLVFRQGTATLSAGPPQTISLSLYLVTRTRQ